MRKMCCWMSDLRCMRLYGPYTRRVAPAKQDTQERRDDCWLQAARRPGGSAAVGGTAADPGNSIDTQSDHSAMATGFLTRLHKTQTSAQEHPLSNLPSHPRRVLRARAAISLTLVQPRRCGGAIQLGSCPLVKA